MKKSNNTKYKKKNKQMQVKHGAHKNSKFHECSK